MATTDNPILPIWPPPPNDDTNTAPTYREELLALDAEERRREEEEIMQELRDRRVMTTVMYRWPLSDDIRTVDVYQDEIEAILLEEENVRVERVITLIEDTAGEQVEEVRYAGQHYVTDRYRGINIVQHNVPYLDEPEIVDEKELNAVRLVDITPAGALIQGSRDTIPELARVTLDNYSNNRVKELKLVTKAFKSKFPFYSNTQQKKSFNKVFEVLKKAIHRNIPYLDETKVPFIDIPLATAGQVIVRVGPYHDPEIHDSMIRYVRRLTRYARNAGLPIVISAVRKNYIKPPAGQNERYARYYDKVEEAKNTYEIVEIVLKLSNVGAECGYLFLLYLNQILKVFETLHRKAHYAGTTFRQPEQANNSNG